MNRNGWILVCAGVLLAGLSVAWSSISGVEAAGSTPGPIHVAAPETEPPAAAPVLERTVEELEPTRAAAEVRVETPVEASRPVLVSGTVVDDRKVPVGGASVFVWDADAQERRRSTMAVADGSGRFVLRESRSALHLIAGASKPGYLDAKPVPFDRGAQGIELVLERGGVIAGTVLVDPGIPVESVRLHLESSTESRDRLASRGTGDASEDDEPGVRTPAKDGAFAFEGVPAKDARLVVTIVDDASPLLEIRAIQVREVGEPTDPRIDPVDLRGMLELVTIEVQDDQGKSCSNAMVVLGDPSGAREARGKLTQEGRATFVCASGPHDVEVELAGWRRAHLASVHGNQVVQLKRGFPVRVVLGRGAALPPEPSRLFVGLLVDVEHPRSVLDGTAAFSEQREAAFLVSTPGPHEVAWYVESGTTRYFLVGTPRRTVRIADQDEEQVIRLDFDPEIRSAWESVLTRVASAK